MTTVQITDAELVILSLVAERPVYGYEIDQIIEQRGMREWTAIGFSSIYYLLKKIEGKGWISGKTSGSTREGLQRTIYTITQAGLRICQQATMDRLTIPHSVHNSFLTALTNLPLLSKQQIQKALSDHKLTLVKKRMELEMKKNNQSSDLLMHVDLIFDYSIHAIQCEIEWIENAIKQLGSRSNNSAQFMRKNPNN
jgi:DNA-binding PadR family transcriptional regulator